MHACDAPGFIVALRSAWYRSLVGVQVKCWEHISSVKTDVPSLSRMEIVEEEEEEEAIS